MRNLLSTSILVLTFCICSFGQTNTTSPCPKISLITPDSSPRFNKPQNFSVSVSEEAKNYKIEYKWLIHNGEILEGQGTPTIKVLPKVLGADPVVTIEVITSPEGCARSESGMAPMCECVTSIFIDEFSTPISQVDKARVNNIFVALKNEPNAQLFVIFGYKEKTSQKVIRKRQQEIFNSLTKAGIEKEKITLSEGFTDKDIIRFYIVPEGAEPPIL